VSARAKLIGRTVLGLAISLVAIFLALRSVDLQQAWTILTGAALQWVALMVVFNVVDVLLRSWRWQRLVLPVKHVRYVRMAEYQLIGYLANTVLPARLGELVRSHYLGDREHISRTTALGTVVVERVIDTTVVVLLAAGAILLLSVRGVLVSAVLVGLAVSALLVGFLAVLLVAHRLPGADRVVRRAEAYPRVHSLASRLRAGLAVVGRPRTLVEAVVLTLAAWGASILAFAAGGQSLGVELSLAEAALLASGVALATAIPSAPGYVGTFELAAVTVGQAIGLDPDTAFALGLIVHLSILAVTTIGGGIAFLVVGGRLSEVTADAPPSEAPDTDAAVRGATATPAVGTDTPGSDGPGRMASADR
jgi:uncharacterized protein (TIRG00374 family)